MNKRTEQHVREVVEEAVATAREAIQAFAEKLLNDELSKSSVLEWNAKEAMFHSKMLDLAAPMLRALNNLENNGKTVEEIAQWRISECERFLLGGDYGGNEGPWSANSTSPIANLMNVEEANANRVFRASLVLAIQLGEKGI